MLYVSHMSLAEVDLQSLSTEKGYSWFLCESHQETTSEILALNFVLLQI